MPAAGGILPQVLQAAGALAAVVALVLLAAWAARRHAPRGAAGHDPAALRLRAMLALDARRRLYLLETPHGSVLALTGGPQDCMVALGGPLHAGPDRGTA